MKTFKQFIKESVSASKRVGIEHISSLKPLEFISFCNYLKKDLKGIISQEKVKINLKIDGCGVRFGVDPESKKFYLESSHSGPQFEVGSFSEFARNKYGLSNSISEQYDDVLDSLKKMKELNNYLKTNPVKIHAELLYTPNAVESNNKLQFLVVNYDKAVLGKKFTLVMYKVETDSDETEIIKQIKTFSTPEIKFEDQRLNFNNIDVSYEVTNFLELIEKEKNIEEILKSRKQIDQPAKVAILEIVSEFQKKISKKIISSKFEHVLGTDSMEGIVLYFDNGKVVKVVTDEYKAGKLKFNLDRQK